jgi:hypothetical protein
MRALAAALGLLAAVLWGAWIRIETARADPAFDAADARGLLRSDPALLAYLTQRIVESGGRLPADFGAEPRIQHPFATDVPAEFPLGLEFLVAWAQLAAPEGVPLHVTALRVSAFLAALVVAGVFAAVAALSGSLAWAAGAAALALVTPANYRTIGFLWVGEDLALPLFALHLGWLARATRTERTRDWLGAGLLAAAALSTWHALSFVATIEAALLWLAALGSGRSPLARPRAPWALLPPLLAGLLVPVLRASAFLLSPCAAFLAALALLALAERRLALSAKRARTGLVLATAALVPLLGTFSSGVYAHVHHVVLAKLRFLGRYPDDPAALSFDARLLWQGPFETLELEQGLLWAGWPLVASCVLALAPWPLRRRATGGERLLTAFALASVPAAWMFARLVALAGILLPIAAVLGLARLERRRLAALLLAVLGLCQVAHFADFQRRHRNAWDLPRAARAELSALVEWVGKNVPPDEPILGDFVNSTALLAHTRRPIVLQPKYETDRSRRQAEAFLTAFFHGTSAELAALMRERFRCRTLLVDGHVLWDLARRTAGLRRDEIAPRPGTAAAAFLADDAAVLASIPGFELAYRGASVPGADYRLFRLRDETAR